MMDARMDAANESAIDSAPNLRQIRGLWTLLEPVHAVSYFAPQARAAFEAAGLRGFWRGYFAGRAAPLGAVDAAPVIGMFSGFAPAMVQRALPAVWAFAGPSEALAARSTGASDALRALAPEEPFPVVLSILSRVVAALDPAGRPLGAANAALSMREDDAHARLWQLATTLREYRGDGHVAAAVASDVAGLELVVLRCGLDLRRDVVQPARGWSDEDWTRATQRLARRGWVAADGTATAEGRSILVDIERATDTAAARAWSAVTRAELLDAARRLLATARAAVAVLPTPNPIGTIELWDAAQDPDASTVRAPA